LQKYEKRAQDVKWTIDKKKKEYREMGKNNQELDDKMKEEDTEHISLLEKLKTKLEKLRGEYGKKLENNERMKQVSASEREITQEKMRELEKIEKQIKQTRLELAHKQTLYDTKVAEFRRLHEQQEIFENSQSVLESTPGYQSDSQNSARIKGNPYSLDKRPSDVSGISLSNGTPMSRRAVGADYRDRKPSILDDQPHHKYKTDASSFVQKAKPPVRMCGDNGCNIF